MPSAHRRGPRPPARVGPRAKHDDSWAIGFHPVRTALELHPQRVEKLLVSRDLDGGRARFLIGLARQHRIPFQQSPPEALTRIAGEGVSHQGVAAKLASLPMPAAEELIELLTENAVVLVLDGVEDPRNFGAILRSAAGFGVEAVFIPDRRAVGLSPAAVRTAAGGAELVPVGRAANLGRFLDTLRDLGFHTVALDGKGDRPPWRANLAGRVAWVAGGEEKGVRPSILERCDEVVRIPIREEVGSLNVSVAVAIGLAEGVRQRGGQ